MLRTERRWPAPAKLNLFLHVVGRRADGYHELQTVFQLLDRCDELELQVRPDGRIERRTVSADVPAERDLAIRAARLLQSVSGTALGVDIGIEKRIPAGGGLGGGSSDAATVLVGLNRLWELELSQEQLAALGLALGADVPVFVHGHAAWAEGVGERLTPVELDEPFYLVVDPGCRVPTAEVFGAPALTRSTVLTRIYYFFQQSDRGGVWGHGSVRGLIERTRNDCESWVRERYPPVDEALRWLSRHGPARMTGTGGCVFIPLDEERAARRLCRELPQRWQGFVARGRNISPLARR